MYISLTKSFPTLSAIHLLLIKQQIFNPNMQVIIIDENREAAHRLVCTNGIDVSVGAYDYDEALGLHLAANDKSELYAPGYTVVFAPKVPTAS